MCEFKKPAIKSGLRCFYECVQVFFWGGVWTTNSCVDMYLYIYIYFFFFEHLLCACVFVGNVWGPFLISLFIRTYLHKYIHTYMQLQIIFGEVEKYILFLLCIHQLLLLQKKIFFHTVFAYFALLPFFLFTFYILYSTFFFHNIFLFLS